MKNTMGKIQDEFSEPQHKSDASPKITKPLTFTKDHPLKDLERLRFPRSGFMDDEADNDDELVVVQTADMNLNDNGCDVTNINSNNQIPSENTSHQTTNVSNIKSDDFANNNSKQQVENEERLAPAKIVSRSKSPLRMNNNTTRAKNNNQRLIDSKLDENFITSCEKIEGKSRRLMIELE